MEDIRSEQQKGSMTFRTTLSNKEVELMKLAEKHLGSHFRNWLREELCIFENRYLHKPSDIRGFFIRNAPLVGKNEKEQNQFDVVINGESFSALETLSYECDISIEKVILVVMRMGLKNINTKERKKI